MLLKVLLFSILFFATFAKAEDSNNSTQKKTINHEQNFTAKEQELRILKESLDRALSRENMWLKIYENSRNYKELKKEDMLLHASIKRLSKKRNLNISETERLSKEKSQREVIIDKLVLLQEYERDPFKNFLKPPSIEDVPNVSNPIAVISALSYREKLNSSEKEYHAKYESLQNMMEKIREEERLIILLMKENPDSSVYLNNYTEIREQIQTLTPVVDIFTTTENVYMKEIAEIKFKLDREIKEEMSKAMTVGAILLFYLILLVLIKYLVRKYMSTNDRFYTINKALNITFIIFLILTLLLAYIENVSYLVTILGFASAGIAIAMKDWFMSLMGWFTIVLGGAIHVGDRVKFVRDRVEYVGDIVDISMLRMTMHEDITLTTTVTNRRAGRIIFIPNNFIFTDMISNYTHAGLKTVWDGIDFVVTFDSDIHKASQIAKEITKKYSKGYTDITRKQLNKLRSQYHMKNTNVEPRIFTLIDTYGMKISAWYLTNSYTTLTLRSTISAEIISRIQAEEGIHLAFPTQSVYIDKDVRKPEPNLKEALPEGGLY